MRTRFTCLLLLVAGLPAAADELRTHTHLGRLYTIGVPAGWQHTATSPREGVGRAVFRAPGEGGAMVAVRYEIFDRRKPPLRWPIETLGPRMVRFLLNADPRLTEDETGRRATGAVYRTGLAREGATGHVLVSRSGRTVFTVVATGPASAAPVLEKVSASFAPAPPRTAPGKRLDKAKTLPEMVKAFKASVVLVECVGLGTGTGFFIREDGYLLTNHHVVWNAKTRGFATKIRVHWDESLGKQPIAARVITGFRTSRTIKRAGLDVALLKVDARGFTPIPMTRVGTCELADPLVTLGFPTSTSLMGISLNVNRGDVTRLNRLPGGTINSFFHGCNVTSGNSGSPVVNLMTGGVVGLHTWSLTLTKTKVFREATPIDTALDRFPQLTTYPPGALDKIPVAAHLELGHIYLGQDLKFAALVEFLQVTKRAPKDPRGWLGLADCRWALGQNKAGWAAAAEARKLVSDDPELADAMLTLARLELLDNKGDACLALTDRLLKQRPRAWDVHALRGRALARLGKSAPAYEALGLARKYLEDLLPDAITASGEVALELGEMARADAFYAEGRKKFAGDLGVHLGYLDCLEFSGKNDAALAECEKLAAAFAKQPDFHTRHAYLLKAAGKPTEAVEAFARAYKLHDAQYGRVPFDLCLAVGQAGFDVGAPGPALTGYRRALAIDSTNTRAARAFAGLGRHFSRLKTAPAGAAAACIARARQLAPKSRAVASAATEIKPATLTVDATVALARKYGLTSDVVIQLIRASGSKFALSAEAAQQLVSSGLDARIVQAMRKASGASASGGPKAGITKSRFFFNKDKSALLADLTIANTGAVFVARVYFLGRGTNDGKDVAAQKWFIDVNLPPGKTKPVRVKVLDMAKVDAALHAKITGGAVRITQVLEKVEKK